MKLKEIEGALSLIAAFKNADWVEQHLKALLEVKALADKAIAEQKSIMAQNVQQDKDLNLRVAKYLTAEQALNERELRLKDAEQQCQFRMESERNTLVQSRAAHQTQIELWQQKMHERKETFALAQNQLDEREKELNQRALALDARQGALDQRETALRAESHAHAEKVRKLRELTE